MADLRTHGDPGDEAADEAEAMPRSGREEAMPRSGQEEGHPSESVTSQYSPGTGPYPAPEEDPTPDLAQPAADKPRPWWELQGFATLDEALEDIHRGLDREARDARRQSGEALVALELPGRERELLPDPRFGRTLARSYQVNIKLNFFERNELRTLAMDCAVSPSTLARMLVIRGVRASRRSFAAEDAADAEPS